MYHFFLCLINPNYKKLQFDLLILQASKIYPTPPWKSISLQTLNPLAGPSNQLFQFASQLLL